MSKYQRLSDGALCFFSKALTAQELTDKGMTETIIEQPTPSHVWNGNGWTLP
jgi:hypothetical protein